MSRDEELNLLIVDDEVLETEYILTLLSKTEFVFQNISVAFSMEAAQEILTNHAVDIILCDIEMPQGSGLDLLRWIREKKLPVEALIVTCHPEFSYAQQAMKLSSADYLLKPLDLTQLTQGLSRCVELLKQNLAAQDYLQNQEKMRDLLFQDLMQGDFFGKREELARQMQALRLNYDEGETLLSLYFRMDSSMSRGREGRALARKTVLLNVVQDILFDFKTRPLAFFPEEEAFFIAFQTKDLPDSLSNFYDVRLKRLLNQQPRSAPPSHGLFCGAACFFLGTPQNLSESSGKMRPIFRQMGSGLPAHHPNGSQQNLAGHSRLRLAFDAGTRFPIPPAPGNHFLLSGIAGTGTCPRRGSIPFFPKADPSSHTLFTGRPFEFGRNSLRGTAAKAFDERRLFSGRPGKISKRSAG